MKTLIGFIINLIIMSNGLIMKRFLEDEYYYIFGIKLSLIENFNFLLMFIIFGILSSIYMKNETIGDFIIGNKRNLDFKEVDFKPLNYMNLFLSNFFRFLKDLFLITFIKSIKNKNKRKKEEK